MIIALAAKMKVIANKFSISRKEDQRIDFVYSKDDFIEKSFSAVNCY